MSKPENVTLLYWIKTIQYQKIGKIREVSKEQRFEIPSKPSNTTTSTRKTGA